MADNPVAQIEIRGSDKMTFEGLLIVAEWLHKQAEELVKEGHTYAPNFTARYHDLPERGYKK